MLKLMSAEPLLRTTVALPSNLLTAIDRFVSDGRVVSRDEFVIICLRAHVQQLERDARDAEFQAMTDDSAYQAEARQILGEFADADRDLGFAFGSASPCE
jgi:Arc/MetJ-type ribon-helix-helix transcriptional regulator